MIAIAMLVCLGSSRIERVMSAWSIFFYFAYAVLMLLSLYFFGAKVPEKLLPQAIRIEAIGSAAVYAGFCCAILPVVIFVARHLESRKDAVIAGSLAGPLVFLPGLALLMILIPFYPEIVTAPVPIMNVLNSLHVSWLVALTKIAILGELALVGAGLLHGVNERVATTLKDKHITFPQGDSQSNSRVLLTAKYTESTINNLIEQENLIMWSSSVKIQFFVYSSC